MTRTPVQSSNIHSYAYDVENAILEVEFLNGGVYQYFGVDQELVDMWSRSASLGSTFAAIRLCFPYRKVADVVQGVETRAGL